MLGNLVTLADARVFLRRFVDDGTCSLDAIDARIRECEQRLWPKADWRLSTKRVRIHAQNLCFPLPIEVDHIIWADLDGSATDLRNQAYEFLSSGPGDSDYNTQGASHRNLQDQGEFCTMYDVPVVLNIPDDATSSSEGTVDKAYKLIAFSPYVEDGQKYITARGLGLANDEIRTEISSEWSPGEKFLINQWHLGVEGTIQGPLTNLQSTTSLYRNVTQVYKEVTKGPVTLYAWDTSGNQIWMLSKMVPQCTLPSYRRYRITGQRAAQPGAATTDPATKDAACVLALVKLRYIPPVRPDDVLQIQNLSALKVMCLSINSENKLNLQEAQGLELQAVRLLTEEKQGQEQAQGVPVIIDVEARLRAVNHGYLI